MNHTRSFHTSRDEEFRKRCVKLNTEFKDAVSKAVTLKPTGQLHDFIHAFISYSLIQLEMQHQHPIFPTLQTRAQHSILRTAGRFFFLFRNTNLFLFILFPPRDLKNATGLLTAVHIIL